jgi:DNA-binding CsgD family transcriptional regulator
MPVHIDESHYLELVSLAYEAALEPELWETLLSKLAGTLQANAAATFFVDRRRKVPIRADFTGIDPECLEQYAAHYVDMCPRILVGTTIAAGGQFDDNMISPTRSGRFGEYYDFLEKYDVDSCLGQVVERDDGLGVAFMFYRAGRNADFEHNERRFLSGLHSHLRRAARLSLETVRRSEMMTAYEGLVERLPYAVVLLDRDGEVLALNTKAERLLSRTNGHLRISRGHLEIAHRAGQDQLKKMVAAALASPSASEGDGMPFLITCPGIGPVQLSVSMLPGRIGQEANGLYRLQRIPRALVALTELTPSVDARPLQALFGLTATEADIAAKLASGQDIKAIASSRGVSPGTVRVQLKSVFSKLDVASQAQLVGKVLMVTRIGVQAENH